jgi:hypothetical protein
LGWVVPLSASSLCGCRRRGRWVSSNETRSARRGVVVIGEVIRFSTVVNMLEMVYELNTVEE